MEKYIKIDVVNDEFNIYELMNAHLTEDELIIYCENERGLEFLTGDDDVDVYELMDELSLKDLETYCEERGLNTGILETKDLVDNYYHGDFDIISFFKELGKEKILEILNKMEK